MTKLAASPSKHPRATKAQLVKEIGRLERRLRAAESIADMRKRPEEALRDSREQLRLVIDALPVLISYVGKDQRWRLINKAYETWFGYSREELLGRHIKDGLGRAAYKAIRGYVERALAGESVNYETALPYRRGGERHVHVNYIPHIGEDGEVVGFFSTVTDISATKEAEEALRESEEWLKQAERAALMGYWHFEIRTGELVRSDQDLRNYGLEPGQMAPTFEAFLQAVHPDDRDMVKARAERAMSTHEPDQYEFRTLWPDGTVRTILAKYQMDLDDDGNLVRILGVNQDITERKAAEESLRRALDELEQRVEERTAELQRANEDLMEQRQQLASIADNLPGNVFRRVLHADGTISYPYLSAGARRVFGIDPQKAMANAEHLFDAVHADDRARIQKAISASAESLEPFDIEVRYVSGSGAGKWGRSVSSRPRREPNGDVVWDGLVVDITERKRVEEELKLAKQVAERANIAKSRFLAAASHDVRQPLFALGLFLGSLSERISDEDDRRVIANAEKSHAELGSLFDALLDISKLDAEVIEPNSETFPVDSLLKDMKRDFEPQAREDGLDLRVIPSSAIVETDPTLLYQIVRNLVANAVNHTAFGRVLLGCRHRNGALRIEVWDTGPGIPADQFDQIFEEFHQLDNPSRDRAKGLGLGLAIAQRAAKLIGKQIEVRSTVGKGSMFAIEVPVGDPALVSDKASEITDEIRPQVSGALIMVIEDDRLARVALSELLTVWGFEVVAAASVAEVEMQLKPLARRPDLVIADHHLGNEQTGVDAIETIRNMCDAPIPAFILSGDTAPEVLREVEAKGLSMLHKPIDSKELRKEIQRFLTSR